VESYLAEFIGTMILVLIGCGTAVIAGRSVSNSISYLRLAWRYWPSSEALSLLSPGNTALKIMFLSHRWQKISEMN